MNTERGAMTEMGHAKGRSKRLSGRRELGGEASEASEAREAREAREGSVTTGRRRCKCSRVNGMDWTGQDGRGRECSETSQLVEWR